MTTPGLAAATCTRRLRALEAAALLDDIDWGVSWHGPAGLPPERAGSEASVQAMCGLMEVNGRDGGAPRRLGLEAASVAAGIVAAQGCLAAGVARARGRPAPVVRTSGLQAGLVLLTHYFMVATALGDAVPGPPLPAPGPPFRSSDGRWFEIETLDPEAWKQLWTRLGAGGADLGRGWTLFRWRYERGACSLPVGLHEAAGRHTLEELTAACRASGVSLAPLRSYDDVLADAPNEDGHPVLRPVAVSALGAAAGRTPPTDRGDGALPLDGIAVVEATSRIQGPFAGMLLRMLGADVVRVQPPEGDYGRAAQSLHRAKNTVRLDLATPGGRAELLELVAGADVFLHNWRPGKAEQWGLAAPDLARVAPRLVYAQASGWGRRSDPHGLLGTDFLVQAYAGTGNGLHPEGDPPFPSRVILIDLFGALVAAEGILAGLYRREMAPDGAWQVEGSLLAGAMALQAHVLTALASGGRDGRRGGRPVWGALDRPVPTVDGTLVVGVETDGAFSRLCEACQVVPTAAARPALEQEIVDRLAGAPARHWEELLGRAGVPCAVAPPDLAAVPGDARLSDLFEPVDGGGTVPRSPWSFV